MHRCNQDGGLRYANPPYELSEWQGRACYAIIVSMSTKQLQTLLERAQTWPEEDQEELAQIARDIEARRSGVYRPTPEELLAIDEADQSGVASDAEVEAAFRSFRRA
jgi:hypothetical protein